MYRVEGRENKKAEKNEKERSKGKKLERFRKKKKKIWLVRMRQSEILYIFLHENLIKIKITTVWESAFLAKFREIQHSSAKKINLTVKNVFFFLIISAY